MNDCGEDRETGPRRIVCFAMPDEAKAIDRGLMKLLASLRETQQRQFVSKNNVMRYQHGGCWHHPANSDATDVRSHRFETVWHIPYDGLVDNDLSLISRSLNEIGASMDEQFVKAMYAMVGDAAESVGNVVDAKEMGSIAESFLEMLRKVEIGVDRDGTVSMPQLHVHPDTWPKVQDELGRQPPEFSAEVERIQAEKAAAAFEREAMRKARFKKRGAPCDAS